MFGKTLWKTKHLFSVLTWHQNLKPRQIHSTKPSQMFLMISHTGSLIIFDRTLLAMFSQHISVSLVWQMRPIVDFFSFSPCHQSSGQHWWHWEWLEEKKRAVTGLSKQSQHDQSCWVEENTVYNDWRGAGGGRCSETHHLNTKFLWHCSS